MRNINWKPWKDDPTERIDKIRHASILMYDEKGKIYDPVVIPRIDLPVGILVVADVMGNNFDRHNIVFFMNKDGYCGVFYKQNWSLEPKVFRLSSLPEHEYYFRKMPWWTIADRDYVWREITHTAD